MVGDPPYPIKKNNPVLKQEMDRVETAALQEFGIKLPRLTEAEKVRVKICDALDCQEFAEEEVAMGNATAVPIIDRIDTLMGELVPKLQADDCAKLLQYAVAREITANRRYAWKLL